MGYPTIPASTLQSLRDYVTKGYAPGSFVEAVLSNNLKESFGRADLYNREAMFDIVSYCYNELPAASWGCEEKYISWLKMFRSDVK